VQSKTQTMLLFFPSFTANSPKTSLPQFLISFKEFYFLPPSLVTHCLDHQSYWMQLFLDLGLFLFNLSARPQSEGSLQNADHCVTSFMGFLWPEDGNGIKIPTA
jgi:hypothetical protein